MMSDYDNIKYAEYYVEPKESERKEWYGVYKGVRFEINRFKGFEHTGNDYSWTYYIHLDLDLQFEKEIADKFWLEPTYYKFTETSIERLMYTYNDFIINKIEFHGGCTFYSKESSPDDKCRRVKIGCDYQHFWDEGKNYNLSYVYGEVQQTIDSLIRNIAEPKVRSSGDGKFRFIKDFKQDV